MRTLNKDNFEETVQAISYDVASQLDFNRGSIVNFDSADFDVVVNEIKLSDVLLDEWHMRDIIEDVLKNYLQDFIEEEDKQ